jgi:DNA-binding MarR family transcriptional regulator
MGPANPNEVMERLFETGVLLTEAIDRGLAERGLRRARAEVIWRLHQKGPATQRELSDALRCTPRNVTGLVDALEATGLVARSPHPTDRRATLVTLTGQGSALAAEWHTKYQKLATLLVGDLDPAALSAFAAMLDHILERLRTPASNYFRRESPV